MADPRPGQLGPFVVIKPGGGTRLIRISDLRPDVLVGGMPVIAPVPPPPVVVPQPPPVAGAQPPPAAVPMPPDEVAAAPPMPAPAAVPPAHVAVLGQTIPLAAVATLDANTPHVTGDIEVIVGKTFQASLMVINASGAFQFVVCIQAGNGDGNWKDLTTDLVSGIGYSTLTQVSTVSTKRLRVRCLPTNGPTVIVGGIKCVMSDGPAPADFHAPSMPVEAVPEIKPGPSVESVMANSPTLDQMTRHAIAQLQELAKGRVGPIAAPGRIWMLPPIIFADVKLPWEDGGPPIPKRPKERLWDPLSQDALDALDAVRQDGKKNGRKDLGDSVIVWNTDQDVLWIAIGRFKTVRAGIDFIFSVPLDCKDAAFTQLVREIREFFDRNYKPLLGSDGQPLVHELEKDFDPRQEPGQPKRSTYGKQQIVPLPGGRVRVSMEDSPGWTNKRTGMMSRELSELLTNTKDEANAAKKTKEFDAAEAILVTQYGETYVVCIDANGKVTPKWKITWVHTFWIDPAGINEPKKRRPGFAVKAVEKL